MTTPETTPPTVEPVPVPPDTRSINDMPFAGGVATRALLTRCGVSLAHEIEVLGCTGAAMKGLVVEEIAELRLGLGGGGVGLPCFIKSDRFCLAHNTIGGLQEGQAALHPGYAYSISRALTSQEAGSVAYMETVRRTGKGGVGEQMATAAGALSGFGELPHGAEVVEDDLHDTVMRNREAARAVLGGADVRAVSFTCPEHTKTNWSCRFCVAQAITEGELETEFIVHQPEEEGTATGEARFGISGPEMLVDVETRDAAGAKEIEVYVLAATYKRKLSR